VITNTIFLSQVIFENTCAFYGQVKQDFRHDYNEAAGDNLEVKGPVRSQHDPPNALG
jgi:hypothetical protein